jgi:hypothetical protein
MVLEGKGAIGLLDLLIGGAPPYSQYFVIISFVAHSQGRSKVGYRPAIA